MPGRCPFPRDGVRHLPDAPSHRSRPSLASSYTASVRSSPASARDDLRDDGDPARGARHRCLAGRLACPDMWRVGPAPSPLSRSCSHHTRDVDVRR